MDLHPHPHSLGFRRVSCVCGCGNRYNKIAHIHQFKGIFGRPSKELQLQLKPSQTDFSGPASMVKPVMKPFLASTSMVKPQNRGFTSFMDGFYLGGSKVGIEKSFCQTFFKTAPTPPEKPLHQRSQSRSCFWRSRNPTKHALNSQTTHFHK